MRGVCGFITDTDIGGKGLGMFKLGVQSSYVCDLDQQEWFLGKD